MNKIKKTLLRARLDSISFSGHFFRQETINTAIIVGISKEQIKLLSKWKSNAIEKYFFDKISISMNFTVNKQFHLIILTKNIYLNRNLHLVIYFHVIFILNLSEKLLNNLYNRYKIYESPKQFILNLIERN